MIYLAQHKSGSQLINKFCKKLAAALGCIHFGPNLPRDSPYYVFNEDLATSPLWAEDSFLAGPIRVADFLPPDLDLSQTKTILHLRDPRDVLVSLYFSEVYSHPATPTFTPGEDWRDEWRNRSIDDFVMMKAPEFLERYERFFALCDKYNLKLKTYEEMVLKPEDYFSDICKFFGATEHQVREIVAEFTSIAARRPPEDKQNHVRKVTPGDHREKLSAETIQKLDQTFSIALGRLKTAWSEAGL